MASFALDLQRFADKAKARADDLVANVVIRIASDIDKASPVGDAVYWKSPPPKGYIGGHFRANWQLGVGVRPKNEIPGVDPTGGKAQGRIMAEIPTEAAGKIYWLANNAPYAQRLEYGWSRQAPQGIVGLTVTRWQQIVAQSLAAMP